VAAILSNPRYTGRQVWNRQRTDRATRDGQPGPFEVHRWNTTEQWVISQQIAHPAIVSEADFVAAQAVNANPTRPTDRPEPPCWSAWSAAACAAGGCTCIGYATGRPTGAGPAPQFPAS
jgi:hypothetical protein